MHEPGKGEGQVNVDLLSTIEAIQRQTSAPGVFDLLHKAIGSYGFDRFIVSGLPDPGMDLRPLVLLSGWPVEFYERYIERGYVHFDPVARHCFSTAMPFAWADAPVDPQADRLGKRVLDEAGDFGLREGLCVPIHLGSGAHGAVSLVGSPRHLTDALRLELHMLALYVHGQMRYINTLADEASQRRAITHREAEVLKWAANGKTAYEIAAITGLTERTVNQHCENAQRKLGTSNRLHTVVEAIRYRLIAL